MLPAIQCESIGKCYRTFGRPHDWLVAGLRGRLGGGRAPTTSPDDFWALRDISLEVLPGETVGIIGPNGSGKSTLLQIIAGTVQPTTGSVATEGRLSALLELGAGFNPGFTGIENVRMNASVLGLDATAIERKLDDILAFADIGVHATQPVRTYSSGMFVRLAFAVAIHVEPRVLLVDEALAVGDISFQAKCMLRVRRLQDEGTSILFVSHDLATVRSLCSRALYLEGGRSRSLGRAPAVVDAFIRDVQNALEPAAQPEQVEPTAGESPVPVEPGRDLRERFESFDADRSTRRPSGAACVRLVDMVDARGLPVRVAEFDAAVTVRIWVQCVSACAVSVNYKIRNRQLESVAGADFLIASHDLVAMEAGSLYRIEYQTRLPLMDGTYTLRVSVTIPIDKHDHAEFLDVVEVAHPFSVLPAERGRIYTNVYLPNTVSIVRTLAAEA